MNSQEPTELVEVRLLGIPLGIQRRSSEHNDGLRREFQLLVEQGQADPSSVPARLVKLAADLDRRFLAFTESTRGQIEDAIKRGDAEIDVTLRLPPDISPAARQMGELLREADAYCAAGEHLLTLAAPPEVVEFRQWVLDELIRQVEEGADPVPWEGRPRPS